MELCTLNNFCGFTSCGVINNNINKSFCSGILFHYNVFEYKLPLQIKKRFVVFRAIKSFVFKQYHLYHHCEAMVRSKDSTNILQHFLPTFVTYSDIILHNSFSFHADRRCDNDLINPFDLYCTLNSVRFYSAVNDTYTPYYARCGTVFM